VIRTITGFHLDDEGDWVAELSCLHNQHVRHRPPFQVRSWVLDEAGREARIGTDIECSLCDRADLPDGLVVRRVLGPWDRDSVPAGLQRDHRTPNGLWGFLAVRAGSVEFQFEGAHPRRLAAGDRQAIPPDRPHRVILDRPACLELQLLGPA
jgi:tellurite methyltransferase